LFLKEQWYKFQITNLAQQANPTNETPKSFVEVYQDCNIEEKDRLCEFYLHNLVFFHPYKWIPNPYVGDVKIMDFSSWLRHEELKEVEINFFIRNKSSIAPSRLGLKFLNLRMSWPSMTLFLQTKMWPQFGRKKK
jgi:hypothetical protein